MLMASGISFGQTTKAAPRAKAVATQNQQTKEVKEEKREISKTRPAGILKKDGTPDKRYKANKKLKKDGTPDKRYKENQASPVAH